MASTTASASAASDIATPILPENSSTTTRSVSATGSSGERAGAARELEMARGELVPRPSSASARAMRQASQSQRSSSSSESGSSRNARSATFNAGAARDIALAGEEGEPVEQQIAGARGGLPVGGQNGRGDLARIAAAHQAVGGEGRRERVEVGLARERRIQRLEPPGRLEQQRRSVAAARHREGDLRVQQLGAGLLELVQRSRLRDRQQPQRRVGRAGLVLALAATSARCARRLGSGVSSAARSWNAAPAARPPRARARPAERSSSAATSSSSPAVACARCQARRSGSTSASVASASARWTRWRSSGAAAP